MPLYNEERHVALAIESWLTQSYQNIELVISDNCSTDQTYAICQRYAERDTRIILGRNPTNLGATYNCRKVLDSGKGKYFIFSAGHDGRSPELLSTCVPALEAQPNVVLAYPQALWMDSEGNSLGNIAGCIETRGMEPLSRLAMALWGLGYAAPVYGLFKTDALKRGSIGKVMLAPDVLLLCELALLGEFAYIPAPLLHMRRQPDFGSWSAYVGKLFSLPLADLSAPGIFWQMIEEFARTLGAYFADEGTRHQVMGLVVQGVMFKYGSMLPGLLNESRGAQLSANDNAILQRIQRLNATIGSSLASVAAQVV